MEIRILNIALLFTSLGLLASFNAFAQPATVTPETNTLFPIGTNSLGVVTSLENTDSVTIGGTTKYYALPDPVVNPSFNYSVDLFANIVSTFAWTVPAGLSSGGAVAIPAKNYGNYKQIVWTGTGTGNIQVVETSSGGCAGSASLTPVAVIVAPAVTAIAIPNITCHVGLVPYTLAGPAATLTITCVVNGNKGLSVNYSLTGPGTSVLNQTAVLGSSNTLDLSAINLPQPGIYTLQINTITDRIATKSGLTAIANVISQTFAVTPQPVSVPLYHITNQ